MFSKQKTVKNHKANGRPNWSPVNRKAVWRVFWQILTTMNISFIEENFRKKLGDPIGPPIGLGKGSINPTGLGSTMIVGLGKQNFRKKLGSP